MPSAPSPGGCRVLPGLPPVEEACRPGWACWRAAGVNFISGCPPQSLGPTIVLSAGRPSVGWYFSRVVFSQVVFRAGPMNAADNYSLQPSPRITTSGRGPCLDPQPKASPASSKSWNLVPASSELVQSSVPARVQGTQHVSE